MYEAISAVKALPLKPTDVRLRPYGEDKPANSPCWVILWINHLSFWTEILTKFFVLKAQYAGCLLG